MTHGQAEDQVSPRAQQSYKGRRARGKKTDARCTAIRVHACLLDELIAAAHVQVVHAPLATRSSSLVALCRQTRSYCQSPTPNSTVQLSLRPITRSVSLEQIRWIAAPGL